MGVVIPIYNRATVVIPTLDSVVRQTLPPAKLIVIDDGSTDDSAAAVAQFFEAVKPKFETRLLCRPHETAAAARNHGLREVGDLSLVAFLDSDDRWPEDFLERAVGQLWTDSSAVAATVDRRYLNTHGEVFRFDDCRPFTRDPIPWLFGHGAGVASSTLLRTAAVRAAGGWPAVELAEDAILFVQVALLGRWLHVPGSPVEYYHGNASARNEEGNLSFRHPDAFRRWAQAYEAIYESLAGRYPERKRTKLRPVVAVYWYRAGKQLDGLGQAAEARDCYERAMKWRPTMFRAWRRLLWSQWFARGLRSSAAPRRRVESSI